MWSFISMKLNDFKVGDIVVVICRNDNGSSDYKFLQSQYPLNLVSEVGVVNLRWRNGLRTIKNKEVLSVFINRYCELREATEREKFLYHIYGPHVMSENK